MAIQQRFAAVVLASEERFCRFQVAASQARLRNTSGAGPGKGSPVSAWGTTRARWRETAARGQPVASPVQSLSFYAWSWSHARVQSDHQTAAPDDCVVARATPSFPWAMTCTGGPLKARWAADWRPFPPLPSWQCTATQPELWLASTLLRSPVCGDSLLCNVRPVWRPGHATSGAEAAMPRGPG